MGILGRSHSKNGKSAGTTVIAAGTNLVGDLALDDNLHIDGKLEGTIKSKAEVVIGESGLVDGEISARRILVSGTFVGKIDAERLEIVAAGKVTGEISVSQLVVESGAHFNGTSHIRGDEPPRQLTHEKTPAMDHQQVSEAAAVQVGAPTTDHAEADPAATAAGKQDPK